MAKALGSGLRPPGRILGGILRYVVATGSDNEGDLPEIGRAVEEEAMYLLELKALQVAAEITEFLVDRETWNEICDEICDEIDGMSDHQDQPKSWRSAVGLMIEVVNEGIRNVDYEAYLVFTTAFEAVGRQIDLGTEVVPFENKRF